MRKNIFPRWLVRPRLLRLICYILIHFFTNAECHAKLVSAASSPANEGEFEYIEQEVPDRRQGVFLQLAAWGSD
jgi:hypothetical protein